MAVPRGLYFPVFLSLCLATQTLSDLLVLSSVTASYYTGMCFYCLFRNGRAIWHDVFEHMVNFCHNFHREIKYFCYTIELIKLDTLIKTECSNIPHRKKQKYRFLLKWAEDLTEVICLFIHVCAWHLCLLTP